MLIKHLILFLTVVLLSCATIPLPGERRSHADQLAAKHSWNSKVIQAGKFDLVAYVPETLTKDEVLTVYIEGDGFAWLTGSTPSADPTPRDPLALRLALAHPAGNAAYLARPCQYVDAAQTGCAQRYWTEARFAPEVVEAMNIAADALKARFGAQRLTLVGYSGGANIAALLAARRQDVVRLVTVAGNIDHAAWTHHHRVQPLQGSLNAADQGHSIRNLPQTHFVGGRDRVIPVELARNWGESFLGDRQRNLRILPDYDHQCCWAENWGKLFQ
jgi:hypothetical protein